MVNLKEYIQNKEEKHWVPDIDNDGEVNFNRVCRPIYILISLYLFKTLCLQSKYWYFKIIIAISFAVLADLAATYFDATEKNDTGLHILAIPISVILIGQAIIDAAFLFGTTDIQTIIFYSLDSRTKTVAIISNLITSLIYCVSLFYWFTLIETNITNQKGR